MPGIQFGIEGAGEGFAVKSAADITLTMLSAVAVVATPVVLLPVGSCIYGATFLYFISSGAGSVGTGGAAFLNTPAAGTTTFVATIQAGDTYTFSMLADGSFKVNRSAGTFSCLVNVLIMYG